MTVQVSPHGLGNVTARVEARGSQVTVSMSADSEAGREALRNALPGLAEHLRTGGSQQVDVSLDSPTSGRGGTDRRTAPSLAARAPSDAGSADEHDPLLTTSVVGGSDRLLDLSL